MFAANKFLSCIPVISTWHSDTEKPNNKHGILSGLYHFAHFLIYKSVTPISHGALEDIH